MRSKNFEKTWETQRERVLDYLEHVGPITQYDASRLGIMRLAARICELRKEGYGIVSELIPVEGVCGPTYIARYTLGAA